MKDIFLNRVASSHEKSQNWFMAELGLTSKEDQRFSVGEHNDGETTVYIFDNSQRGLDRLMDAIHFSSEGAAKAFIAIMEQEVGTWDCEEFYTAGDVQQDAVASYEAANSGVAA